MPFRDSRTLTIQLKDYGDYLGRGEGCFQVKHKNGEIERYPHFQKEVGEAVLTAGSCVSTDALIDLALWNIDTYFVSRHNRVVAVLRNLEDDSHVETRVAQYQSLSNGKSERVAVQIIRAKIEGQNKVLSKYGLKLIAADLFGECDRKKLVGIESRAASQYFSQIFQLLPENLRPEKRIGFKAYDGLNNVFNFGYYVLKCRVHKALLKAKLEPYLGFLHSVQVGKPSLVCDFMELYRYLIDDYLIERCQKYRKKDFVFVTDFMMRVRSGKRVHLCEYKTNDLAEGLKQLFEKTVEIPRMRHGSKQTLDTLINEEAYLLAQYLRNEKQSWTPRLATI